MIATWSFRITAGMTAFKVNEFLLEFESRYDDVQKHGMKYNDDILGCMLLDKANIEVSQRQMVLTAAKDLKYENIRSALKRLFCSVAKRGTGIKSEE